MNYDQASTSYERQRQRGNHHLVAISHVTIKPARVIDAVLEGPRPCDPHYHLKSDG
jgi:hypothetical protein